MVTATSGPVSSLSLPCSGVEPTTDTPDGIPAMVRAAADTALKWRIGHRLIAERAGVSKNTVTAMFSGRINTSYTTAFKVWTATLQIAAERRVEATRAMSVSLPKVPSPIARVMPRRLS